MLFQKIISIMYNELIKYSLLEQMNLVYNSNVSRFFLFLWLKPFYSFSINWFNFCVVIVWFHRSDWQHLTLKFACSVFDSLIIVSVLNNLVKFVQVEGGSFPGVKKKTLIEKDCKICSSKIIKNTK